MSILAVIAAVLTIAGAVAAWIAGAVIYRQASPSLLRAAVWPFLSRQVPGAPADHAIKLNKALVALFTCLTLAVAATSLATNLSRLSR
jgi:hypothetical protein